MPAVFPVSYASYAATPFAPPRLPLPVYVSMIRCRRDYATYHADTLILERREAPIPAIAIH